MQTIKEATDSKFWMRSLFPDSTVPDELCQVQKEDGWDAFYRQCFRYLHKVRNIWGSYDETTKIRYGSGILRIQEPGSFDKL